MNIIGLIGQIFKPAMDMIDNVHTSKEEALIQKVNLMDTYVKVIDEGLSYEMAQLEAKTQIITAEANSASWIARNWRPITMLTFLALVVLDSFGLLPWRLASQAWTLLQIGLGGYVVGRSAEKVTSGIVGALKKKDEV